jgi:hypothetical protein
MAAQVSQRPRHFKNAIMRTRAEIHLAHRMLQAACGLGVEFTVLLDQPRVMLLLVCTPACLANRSCCTPHILDYYYVGSIGGRGAPVVEGLLAKGKAGLADVPEGDLTGAKGKVSPVAERQLLQREYTLRNEEFRSPALPGILAAHRYVPGSHGFDALVVGYYEKKKLLYAGRSKTALSPEYERIWFHCSKDV